MPLVGGLNAGGAGAGVGSGARGNLSAAGIGAVGGGSGASAGLIGTGSEYESIAVATWIASVLFVSCVCFGNIGRRLVERDEGSDNADGGDGAVDGR